MKKLNLMIVIAFFMSTYCLGQDEVSLRKELEILKPMVGKTWVSETKHPNGKLVLHFEDQYELIHNGKVIKMHGECKELNIQSDGYYYYDPDKKEITFLILSSNGNYSVGNIKLEEDLIVKYGYTILPDRKLKFRNTLEFTPDGELIDKYFRIEDGEWKPGHSKVFKVK